MISATLALTFTLLAGAPVSQEGSDAPTAQSVGLRLAAARTTLLTETGTEGVARRFTLADAPTSRGTSFFASLLSGVSGLVFFAIGGLSYDDGLNGNTFAFHARVSSALLLMSAGPSVGDLMNEDLPGFLIGAGGRSVICAGAYGLIAMANSSSDPELGVVAALATTLGTLAWMSWSVTDLVRSLFAPRRWVERQNRALAETIPSREPIAEVRQAGGLRSLAY